MTTIIYKDGMLLADMFSMSYGVGMCSSKFRISKRTGSIFACAGDRTTILKFIRWYEDGEDYEKLPSLPDDADICIVELTDEGLLHVWYEDFERVFLENNMFATGSGGQFAIGAMLFGADAEEAMRIAIKCDINTGAPFEIFDGKQSDSLGYLFERVVE